MIEVNQRVCEWAALCYMAKCLAVYPYRFLIQYPGDAKTMMGALEKIANAIPENMSNQASASVLFTPQEVEVLVRLVEWFDRFMLANVNKIDDSYSDVFAKKYQQVGLINRNLKLYAKTYTDPEIKERRHDDPH